MSLEEARTLRDEIATRQETLQSLRRAHREAERAEMTEIRDLQRRYERLVEQAIDEVPAPTR